MENHWYPHPHLYPHTRIGIKRAYSDENSPHSDEETTTLIGNDFVAADRHGQIFSAQHGQQRRRTSQMVPIASPLDLFPLPEEDYCLQGSVQPSNQGFLYSTTPRHLADNTGGSGLYTPSYGLTSPFNNLNQAQSHSLPFQNPSNTFGHMGSDGRRGQRLARFVVEDSIDSGSEDTKTLRSSQSLSRTTSLGGPHDLMLNTPNDISQSSISDSSYSFTMMGDLAENDTREGLATLGTHDPYDPYSETWPHQGSPPWSTYGTPYPQRYVSNQRLSLNPINEELLHGDPHLEPMNISSVNPSQISFESINLSQTSNEIPVEGYSNTFQDYEPATFVGLSFPFSGYQDQEDAGIGGIVLDVYDKQSPYTEVPGSNSDTTRSFQLTAKDPTTSDLFTPLVRQASVETSHTMNHCPLTIQSSIPEERNRDISDRESVYPKAAFKCEWEHSIVSDGRIRTLESHTQSNASTKKTKGVRKHPLSVEARKKAAEVRRKKSCLRCWSMHIPCDEKEVCDNCRRLPSPFASRICLKTPLYHHVDSLFPELVVARHDKAAIAKVIKDNDISFGDNEIQVQISSGPHYPPITLSVCEFSYKNDDFLLLYHAPPNASSPSSILIPVYGPPVGFSGSKIKGRIKEECRKHIKEMTKHERFPGDATNGDAAPVSKKTFEAINRYRSLKPGSANLDLIRKATRLLATHYFMRKIISFTQDSTQKVYDSLTLPTKLPYVRRPSSKLLNYQVKREVHLLQRELTKDILQEVEVEMRKKSLCLWVTCFSVLAILCMCMEAVQLSIDGFIVQGLLTDGPGSNLETRNDGFHKSRLLEDQLFRDLLDIFHTIYRSGKFKDFHPIRDGANADNSTDLDQSGVQFINEIHEIVKDNRGHLEEKAKRPSWGAEETLLLDHYRYRRENSGRLVAKFLLSFR